MNRSTDHIARFFTVLFLVGSASCSPSSVPDAAQAEYEQVTRDYIEAWKEFYPTSAVRLGLDQYLAKAENRNSQAVTDWIGLNEGVMNRVTQTPDGFPADLRIDLRLLRSQVAKELTLWRDEEPHLNSPALYASIIQGLARVPEDTKRIGGAELETGVQTRLAAISHLTGAMANQLRSGPEGEIRRSVEVLSNVLASLDPLSLRFPELASLTSSAGESIHSAQDFLETQLDRREEARAFPLGREKYSEELRRYYDMEVTPEEVAQKALNEIATVRALIEQASNEYWEEARPGQPKPTAIGDLVAQVSLAMEENRPSSEQESLETFSRFAEEAEAFVPSHGIATLPSEKTLEIRLTPASAGPSQRIGFVASPPPFDPDPMTILSLPTIPDSFPEAEKEDFYRSFNNHFNKMIIIHELFPGHYMQLKIASGNPRQVRTFFPYHPYVEGWATLTEKFALDAGWDDFNKLTYLSHLRKRLENANRAYTSVQVHCNGWTEEQVSEFSEEEALLAPQFAKSLFGRLQRGPMQMTSYFMGKDMFMEVLEAEQERLGDEFVVRDFTDVILHAGAVPMDMLPALLRER